MMFVTSINHIKRVIMAVFLAFTAVTISFGAQMVHPAAAYACEATHYMAVGGNGDPGAGYFPDSEKVWYEASANFPSSVPDGTRKLDAALAEFHGHCPGTHIVVWGYSEGAWVTAMVLSGTHGGVPAEQLSGVLFGDPTRPGNNSFGVAPTVTDFHGVAVARHCLRGDAVCDGGSGAIGWVNGGYGFIHGQYKADPRWNDWLYNGGDGDWIE